MIYFQDITLRTDEQVYEPAEDSYLLALNQRIKKDDSVLDLGTGCGIQGITAAKQAADVLATDINRRALKLAEKNAKRNNIKNIRFRLSDMFTNITEKYDVILFNPPYLPVKEKSMIGRSWSGGLNGCELINHFIQTAPAHLNPGGSMQFIVSSLNDWADIKTQLTEQGLDYKMLAEKKIAFERLHLLSCFKQ
ncbi:MAG: hypothetical protein B6U97_01435 [Candidatus Altiarchaeales archaeon ex4484_96]|nr:MAG: hypothetical protein B6U97_01435 [Candidatus Altiarchaeales archaeon ex4484_96]